MRRNNYDTSSSGININMEIFLSTQLASDEFHENFEIIEHSDRGTASILRYTDYGNYPLCEGEDVEKDNYKYDSVGYSQGDLAHVYIPEECFESWTSEKALYETIDHLLWDAPLDFYIEIDDDIIDRGSLAFGDPYEPYDKDSVIDAIIDFVKSNFDKEYNEDVLKRELGEIIPDYEDVDYK